MRKTTMTLAVAASTVFASQAAMAYQAGDVYVRGSFEKAEVTTDNISDENAFYLSGGYLFHDKMGVELGVGESVEHDFFGLAGNDLGTMERMPVNLLVNYYPLGGIEEARVQPFVGLGVNYTRYSSIDEAAPYDIDIDDDYGVVGQVGVDLTLTSNLSATGYARWADVDAEIDWDTGANSGSGTTKLDPVTIGAGLTYRF
ncbi:MULTISPECIES: OmpW family outer membrane protein [unclassified Halomonas]|uniref:OmpW/AlkL family protein n=1 Tax=unclassified Halomonas TaxID=2609666 RepID=UPI002885C3FD|nr:MULTISPECIES: OmpW family outer membrane protein [unclassified Halomonas]MDT0500424.1 OmpW family outer membrane protein [Halomonas sp. PAR7]MDT0511679.1 OmpW family outer membrane protein [Halomonas sp. LES1]MDT0590033.1 OmpW family outer membrane protein [Halomonas sp. PAR8]